MARIAIVAFGSLIDEPGEELCRSASRQVRLSRLAIRGHRPRG